MITRLLILGVLLCGLCRGATYYVATNGNDSLDGLSLSNAWLTVSKGALTAEAGDTVLFSAGVWNETLNTKNVGTSDNRIIFDGQGVATIKRVLVNVNDEYNTIQNFTISGYTTPYNFPTVIYPGANFTVISNCFYNNTAMYVGAVRIDDGTEKPFDSTCANNCIITDNVINYISGEYAAFKCAGTNNVFQYNTVTNIAKGNPLYMFGQYNIVRGNRFEHTIYPTNVAGSHPDFVQTFGVNGDGSMGHIIENNVFIGDCTPELLTNILTGAESENIAVMTVAGGQLTTGDTAVTMPATYPSNSFTVSVVSSYGYTWTKGDNEVSLVAGSTTYTNTAKFVPRASTVTINGTNGTAVTCTLWAGYCWDTPEYFGGWIFRNNVFAHSGGSISMGLYQSTWVNNIFYRMNMDTYNRGGHALSLSSSVARSNAEGTVMLGNVFLDCGGPGLMNQGWYSIGDPGQFTNLTYDFNYVGKTDYGAMLEADPATEFRWHEDNGVNGGDPQFISESELNFHLKYGSPLIDVGTNATATDFDGWTRPMGVTNDIGAFEFDPNLRVWLDFDQGFHSSGYIEDVTGYGHDAAFPMGADWASADGIVPEEDAPVTNWPTAGTSVNGTVAGTWTQVATKTNDPPQVYEISQYASITNLTDIEYLTNGTVSIWVAWEAGGTGRSQTLLDAGYVIQYSYPPEEATNSWAWRYGPQATELSAIGPTFFRYSDAWSYPTNLIQFDHYPRDATWHHCVVTWNATTQKIIGYENGVPFETNDFLFPYLRVAGRDPLNPPFEADEAIPWLCIGATQHGGSQTWGDDRYPGSGFFRGMMDDIKIWDRTLSESEVEILYGSIGTLADEETEPTITTTTSTISGGIIFGNGITMRGE